MELALDTQLCWLRKGELCSSGELRGFGDCENEFLCSEVPPQVRLARRKNGSLQGCLRSIRAQQWFQLARGITSTCCLASSAHRAQEGADTDRGWDKDPESEDDDVPTATSPSF